MVVFSCARNTGEQKSFAVADGAGRVKKKTTLFCQHQGMNDAQDGIDGIRIGSLANAAAARRGIPLGTKIASIQHPFARAASDAQIHVEIVKFRRQEVYFKLKFCARIRADESGVTVVEYVQKLLVAGTQPNGNVADRDDYAVILDLWG